MSSNRHLGASRVGSLIAACLVAALPADACCPAPPPGERVQIADQEILIVWDAATRTEHFIRRASFSTRLPSFGFLVPTPGVPSLGEAPDALFDRLTQAIRPRVEEQTSVRFGVFCIEAFALGSKRAVDLERSGGVRVLLEQRVAGYDAVVLDADDPQALARWLEERGYDSRPALVEWLRPYVAAKWKLTAFKLAAPQAAGREGEGTRYAVRMSFRTDRPVFPFRTPTDQQGDNPTGEGAGALLRVFFVGANKAAGSFGATPWDARVAYADRRDDLATLLEGALPEGAHAASAWLTAFEDRRWPRAAGDDLYFDASSDPAVVLPPPIVHRRETMIPLDGVAVVVLVALLFLRWWRDRGTGAPPTP